MTPADTGTRKDRAGTAPAEKQQAAFPGGGQLGQQGDTERHDGGVGPVLACSQGCMGKPGGGGGGHIIWKKNLPHNPLR